jgi:predicted amidohydrolase
MHRTRAGLLAVLALVAPQSLPLSAGQPPARDPVWPATLRVAAVQMRSSRDLAANVAATIRLLRQCAADGVQVAVFPECSLTGYFDDVIVKLTARELAEAEKQVARACHELGIAAIVGTPVRDGGKLYNSAVVIDSQGKILERYHKMQLAENWPTPGDHLSVFRLCGVPCSIIICHDERYPELVRLPVLAGARVVFYLSHESPLNEEAKLGPYRAQIQARAVENTVYVIHANAPANPDAAGSHGQSRLIGPDGNILHEASIFREETVTATLELQKATAANARRSLTAAPLARWWQEGLHLVRILDDRAKSPGAAR